MRTRLFGALILVVAACSSSPHWVGDCVEAIDGYWVQRVGPCDVAGCDEAVRAALLAIGDPTGAIVAKVSQADWTGPYDDGDGSVIVQMISPPIGIVFPVMVLDLADGTRRVVPLLCELADGTASSPWARCASGGVDNASHRVGNEPWLHGPMYQDN